MATPEAENGFDVLDNNTLEKFKTRKIIEIFLSAYILFSLSMVWMRRGDFIR